MLKRIFACVGIMGVALSCPSAVAQTTNSSAVANQIIFADGISPPSQMTVRVKDEVFIANFSRSIWTIESVVGNISPIFVGRGLQLGENLTVTTLGEGVATIMFVSSSGQFYAVRITIVS